MKSEFNKQRPKFTSLNEDFVCESCGKKVKALSAGCRNHCPFCLTSKHIDEYPGDRENTCQGLMDAVGYELSGKKGIVLVFCCRRCGAVLKNKAAIDDPAQPDDYDLILKLSKKHM